MSEYIGDELEIFKHARNWKQYYGSFISPYLCGDVLEVGAGIGETTRNLYQASVRSWVCLEPDGELINQIRKKVNERYLPSNIEIIEGTIGDLPSDRKFDTVIYIDVIEHIENDTEELKNAYSLLKPDGHLVILVPAHNFLFSKFDKAIGHFRRYDKKRLKEAVPSQMQKVKLLYLDSVGFFASLANKLLLAQSYPTVKQIKFWDRMMIPLSKFIDPLVFYTAGKTVFGIWKKKEKQT